MRPLEGIKILDFSLAMMGPLSTMMLGDMGAEVIKIERIEGEEVRKGRGAGTDAMFTPEQLNELREKEKVTPDSPMWMANNRNKRSLPIDIRSKQGKAIIYKLAQESDVLLHNFRPGTMEKLGLGYKDISCINAGIIYCTIYGYGPTGPLCHRIGGDLYTQALTGVVSRMGGHDIPPTSVPVTFVDHGGAILTAYAITLALLHRTRTGEGQEIYVNQVDTGMYLQATELGSYLIDGQMTKKTGRGGGNVPSGAFQVKDGVIVTWFASDPFWPQFCRVIGLEHLTNDPRFINDELRYQHIDELYAILGPVFLMRTRIEWQQAFRAARLRADPCLTYEEVCIPHPQVEANKMIVTLDHPTQGMINMLGVPIKLTKSPGRPQRHPPLLGEHTREILSELGYSKDEIEKLKQDKIIGTF